MDNVLQVVRILVLLSIVAFAHKLGYFGVLGGMAFTEFVGMIFMLFALARTFHLFHVNSLLPNTARLATAAILILGAGAIAAQIPFLGSLHGRLLATVKLSEAGLGCLIVGWPVLVRTGSITATEGRALFSSFLARKRVPMPALAHTAAK